MFAWQWDRDTGGVVLRRGGENATPFAVRPVFYEELDLLGFGRFWEYPRCDGVLLWACGRRYFHRGEVVAEARGGDLFHLPKVILKVRNLKIEPVDMAGCVERNADVLEDLCHNTMDALRAIWEREKRKVDATVVAFSGGKDSAVVLDLVRRGLAPRDFFVVFADTTMELSDTYDFVEEAKRFWGDVAFHTARSHYDATETWRLFGPPSRILRWCCTVHKTAPTILLLRKLLGRSSIRLLVIDGCRREESTQRARYLALSPNAKHVTQTNLRPILDWTSAEVWLYTFWRGLPFNRAYRFGLPRVGCALCPCASAWHDTIIGGKYRQEIASLLKPLYEYCKRSNTSVASTFIAARNWSKRMGGLWLDDDAKFAVRDIDESSFKVSLSRDLATPRWLSLVARNDGGHRPFPTVSVTKDDGRVIIRIEGLRDHTQRRRMKALIYKAAYCVGCRACEVECPSGALSVYPVFSINSELCNRCFACIDFCEDGCLRAISFKPAVGGGSVRQKGVDRYRTFGLREAWLKTYFAHGIEGIGTTLGPDQFRSCLTWLREAEILTGGRAGQENKETEIGSALRRLIEQRRDDVVWDVIWINLARNSPLIKLFVTRTSWNIPYTKEHLKNVAMPDVKPRTAGNAINALFNLLAESPLGEKLGYGVPHCEKRKRTITRKPRKRVSEFSLLYCLYRYGEAVKRRHFTVSELKKMTEREPPEERIPESPFLIFGMTREDFMNQTRSIAASLGSDWLYVEYTRNLDSIELPEDKQPVDVLELAVRLAEK